MRVSKPEPRDQAESPHSSNRYRQTIVGRIHHGVEARIVHLVEHVVGFEAYLQAAARFIEAERATESHVD